MLRRSYWVQSRLTQDFKGELIWGADWVLGSLDAIVFFSQLPLLAYPTGLNVSRWSQVKSNHLNPNTFPLLGLRWGGFIWKLFPQLTVWRLRPLLYSDWLLGRLAGFSSSTCFFLFVFFLILHAANSCIFPSYNWPQHCECLRGPCPRSALLHWRLTTF